MLQKQTQEHCFSIHLTASHDQSKNDNSALFKQEGAKFCIMKSYEKWLNIDKSEPLKLLNCSILQNML